MRVAESIGVAAGMARSRGSCEAAGTFPRFVWLQGLPSGPAVINWTSRAEVNAEFAQLRVHADHKSMPISLASVVSLLQAALRKRRAARDPANAALRLRWTVVGPVHRALRLPASSP